MKLWIDDLRTPPAGYIWCKSVKETIETITRLEQAGEVIELLDLDHDAGDYQEQGGDFIRVLDWMEVTHRNYPCRIHTANPVGRQNMLRIIYRNKWRLVWA